MLKTARLCYNGMDAWCLDTWQKLKVRCMSRRFYMLWCFVIIPKIVGVLTLSKFKFYIVIVVVALGSPYYYIVGFQFKTNWQEVHIIYILFKIFVQFSMWLCLICHFEIMVFLTIDLDIFEQRLTDHQMDRIEHVWIEL